MSQDRLRKLAERLDALAEKDEKLIQQAREIHQLRAKAAVDLHAVCARFVRATSELLRKTELILDPPNYSPESFRDSGPNLIQLNARGRLVQVEFQATAELISREDFRVPYILEGAVRCFNQGLLEQDLILEHLLFYCLESGGHLWRYFDERTYRSAAFDEEYLIGLLEQIV